MKKNVGRLRLSLAAAGLSIGLGLVWFALHRSGGPQLRPVELYFADPQAMFLVPVTFDIPVAAKTDPETIVAVVKALATPPEGLFAVVPKEATPSAVVKDKTVTLTLGMSPSSANSEQLMANALAKSLGRLPEIEQVRLALKDIQGRDLPGEHLDLDAPLRPDEPERENSWQAYGPSARVYWSTQDGAYLVPLQVPIAREEAARPMEFAFRTLIAGPASLQCGFLAPSVPPSAKPSFLGLRGGVAEVKVEASLPESAERAIVLTLTEFRSVQAVRFLGAGASDPQSRPAWINKR